MKIVGNVNRLICLLLGVIIALTIPAAAQSDRGELAGTVSDPSGAVIPGATVVATNATTGGKSQTVSTSAGAYHLTDLPIGAYNVSTTAAGFETSNSTGVQVTINSVTSLNVALKVGAQSESVTVDASGLRIETESSDISGTVSSKQIEDLPLSLAAGVGGLRSPETFVFLLPGTTGPGSATTGNTGNGVFFSRLSGGQAYGAEVLLDGASITRSENGSSFDETSPSIEALQEFKVTTSTPSAEFGRTTSGIESFSTKQGANSFHGTGFAIIKNRVFDANNWFNNGYKAENCVGVSEVDCPYSTPQDSKYNYGGVFSGPVRIPHVYSGTDRTFFLFAFEKYQLHLGSVQDSTLPTAAERTGDFSDVLGSTGSPVPGGSTIAGVPYPVLINPCTGSPVLYNQIFNPATSVQIAPGIFCRNPFPGNKITTGLSAAAQKLIQGLPEPNQTPQSTDLFGFVNNYAQNGVAPNTNTTYTIRIDQNISDKDKVFASYNTRQNFKLTGAPNLPAPFNGNGYVQTFTTHYGRAGWDHAFSPTLLNHLNLGYNRTNSVNLGAGFNSTNTLASLGVANDYSAFFPLLQFPSPDAPTTLGQQQNGDNVDNGIRGNESVSWQKGRNSFKFGVDVRSQQYSVIQYNQDTLAFYRDQTAALSNACCGSGNPFASFLLGEVGNGFQAVYNLHQRWQSFYGAGFVEDDVKFSRNLTLNLGIRYDLDLPRHEAHDRTSNFSMTAPDTAAGGIPGALVFGTDCHCNTAWTDTYKKDIAPRIGFAYVLPNTQDKVVLRGGGAIIYGPLQYSDFGGAMTVGYNQTHDTYAVQNPAANTGGAFTPAFRLDSSSAADPTNSTVGFPNTNFAPNVDPTQLTAQNGVGSFSPINEYIGKKMGRPSMTSNWSLQLQDEIAQDLIFTIGYIGQVAQNLHSSDLTNINNIPTSDFSYGDRLGNSAYQIPQGGSNSGVNAPYSTFQGSLSQALRPFPQYAYIQDDCCLENLGHSTYNAMVVSLARRFRNGFNLQASYTWSKAITDADALINVYVGANELAQGGNSGNLKADKSVSAQNLPQQFSLSYIYQLPFGKGRRYLNSNRAADLLIGGWQVGGIQRYSSGQPIGFGCATGIPGYDNCIHFNAGPASNQGKTFASAAYRKNKNGPSAFNGESWFLPAYRPAGSNGSGDAGVPMSQAAFVDVNLEGSGSAYLRPFSPGCGNPAAGNFCSFTPYTLGTPLPRETEAITGPLYLAEDVSLLKDFRLTEKVTFQLKGEAFDLFNRHRMALPSLEPNASTGTFAFGIPGGVDYGPRNMQVSGRFNF